MNKDKYMQNRADLMAKAKDAVDSGKFEEFNALKAQIEKLDADFEAGAAAQANLAALEGAAPRVIPEAVHQEAKMPAKMTGDAYDSDEYKNAFMNFVCRGSAIPSKFKNANATTATADVGAVIPTTTLREIIVGLESHGIVYNSVRKLNIQGGVEVPILDLKPVANWITEAKTSDDQKLQSKTKISFSYFGLECRIAQTLLVSVTTFSEFQAMFVPLAVEAIIKRLEIDVFQGTGSGQMLGITKDPRVTNVITMAAADMGKWDVWKKKVIAKIPLSYQTGNFYMAKGTFDGYIDGMVDANGQPIGRVNYGIEGAPAQRFAGKNVNLVEDDVISPYDTAAVDEVFIVFFDPKDYAINSNLQMTVVHWTDHDTNTIKDKVILICDGKLIDAAGVMLIKKG